MLTTTDDKSTVDLALVLAPVQVALTAFHHSELEEVMGGEGVGGITALVKAINVAKDDIPAPENDTVFVKAKIALAYLITGKVDGVKATFGRVSAPICPTASIRPLPNHESSPRARQPHSRALPLFPCGRSLTGPRAGSGCTGFNGSMKHGGVHIENARRHNTW